LNLYRCAPLSDSGLAAVWVRASNEKKERKGKFVI
jgi:hypothetical protein